ncbi:hypothetical protein DFH11DRAFT_1668974 [Phellopilus nigrolimitatus]|nr:hypothetical protein DFH11DRAFT_1668974 [Phellopilus nigrolimitatus]
MPRRAHGEYPNLNTRNMTREHHHHGHAHGREELTPHAVLASSPMHAHTHPSMLVAMPVAADGANAGPAQSSPARGAASGSNLESPVQVTSGAVALPAPSIVPPSPAAANPPRVRRTDTIITTITVITV